VVPCAVVKRVSVEHDGEERPYVGPIISTEPSTRSRIANHDASLSLTWSSSGVIP
jgi:hypothetical protein